MHINVKFNEIGNITIDSLKTNNNLYGLKTPHPLIGLLDLKNATKIVNHIEMKFEVYVFP